MLAQRRNAPRVRFRTGLLGTVLAIVLVVYAVGQAGFFGFGPYWFAQPALDAGSGVARLFHRWLALKPLVLLAALLLDILQATTIPLFGLMGLVIIGAGIVPSAGMFTVLALAGWDCNTLGAETGVATACHDPLYCCVYHGQTPLCPANTGPCGPGYPQVAGDLAPSTDYLLLQWFSLGFLVAEVLILLFALPIRVLRERKAANYALLVEDAQRRVFGGTLTTSPDDGSDLLTVEEAKAESEKLATEAETANLEGREDAPVVEARVAYAHAYAHLYDDHSVGAHLPESLQRASSSRIGRWFWTNVARANNAFDALCTYLEDGLPKEAELVDFPHPDGNRRTLRVAIPVRDLYGRAGPRDRPEPAPTGPGSYASAPDPHLRQPYTYAASPEAPPRSDDVDTPEWMAHRIREQQRRKAAPRGASDEAHRRSGGSHPLFQPSYAAPDRVGSLFGDDHTQ